MYTGTEQIKERSSNTIDTIATNASIIGGKAMLLATEAKSKIGEVMPQTKQQQRAERRGKLFRWGSMLTGTTALVGAGIKYGPNLVKQYGPDIMKRIPFNKSEAESQASMYDAAGLDESYPDGHTTPPHGNVADKTMSYSAPISEAPFDSRQDSH